MLWLIRMHGWKCGYKLQILSFQVHHSLCVPDCDVFLPTIAGVCVSVVCGSHQQRVSGIGFSRYIYMHFCVHCLSLTTMHLLPLSACMCIPTLLALAISVSLYSVILTQSTYAVEVTNISPLVCEYYRFLCWCWTVRGSWHLMFTGSKQIVG